MANLIKNEKEFFSLLKKGLENDFIRIDNNYVPKPYSNQLNRFYSKDNTFWFARLKIKDSKTIYYFGLKNNDVDVIKPDLILKFNAESSLSPIKFINNQFVILTKFRHNNHDFARALVKNFKISKKDNFYFFVLGEIGSKNILNNLKLFIKLVDYEGNFKDNYLIINDDVPKNLSFNEKNSFNNLKNNVEILIIINYMHNHSFNQKLIDCLIDYLFVLDEDYNYKFNEKNFKHDIPINKYVNFILDYFKNKFENLDEYSENDFKLFKENLENNFDKLVENKSISSISIKGNEFEELYNQYLLLKDHPKVKFHLIPSYGISQDDLDTIFSKLKEDIYNGIITKENDIDQVIEDYFKKYLLNNNSKEIIKHYEEYLNGESFKELIGRFNELKQEDIEDIKNKVKEDINNENLNIEDIDKRFDIYFLKKSQEIKYSKLLENEYNNINKYLKSGLYESEIKDILNEVHEKIINWHDDWSIFDDDLDKSINKILDKKQREIRSETHLRFDELYPNKSSIRIVLELSILSEKKYEKLKNKLDKEIYNLEIRIDDINDELIIKYFNDYVN